MRRPTAIELEAVAIAALMLAAAIAGLSTST